MKKNMGLADRIIRSIIALAFVVLYFTGAIPAEIAWIGLLFSIVFVFTSLFGFCPLYTLFGWSTCGTRKKAV